MWDLTLPPFHRPSTKTQLRLVFGGKVITAELATHSPTGGVFFDQEDIGRDLEMLIFR